MGETGKPPIGVPPYWIVARDRIIELCRAIERNAAYSTRETADVIKIWAKEIIFRFAIRDSRSARSQEDLLRIPVLESQWTRRKDRNGVR